MSPAPRMKQPVRYVLKCRLRAFERSFPVLSHINPKMTMKEATASVVEDSIRAERKFFRSHWRKAHPAEAKEISRHIRAVKRLALVTTYHKRVLDGRVE
jgi:hypothetical protein